MKTRTFFQFAMPSVGLMLALLALPLVLTFLLSVRNCTVEMEMVRLEQTSPFGTTVTLTQRARVDENGRAIQRCEFVGFHYYRRVLGLDASQSEATGVEPVDGPPSEAPSPEASGAATDSAADQTLAGASNPERVRNPFLNALEFTLIYTLATTPPVLILGLLLALGAQRLRASLKGPFIAASLLPFIITPVVGALSIKWLFHDFGLLTWVLGQLGIQIHWMAQAWSARLLIIIYGIWHVVPFAFIVFYAGLQSVPQDSLEAARIDGASAWQRLWYVTLPHLAPLIVFVTMIHLMDAYRVFEPVVVLTQGAFTATVQYLTYFILIHENNPFKASAAAVLTIFGIAILLIPLLRRTWKEQRGGAH